MSMNWFYIFYITCESIFILIGTQKVELSFGSYVFLFNFIFVFFFLSTFGSYIVMQYQFIYLLIKFIYYIIVVVSCWVFSYLGHTTHFSELSGSVVDPFVFWNKMMGPIFFFISLLKVCLLFCLGLNVNGDGVG